VRTADFRQTLIAAVLGVADSPADATRLWRAVMGAVRPVYRDTDRPDHYHRTPM
jgi:hypothetical protein